MYKLSTLCGHLWLGLNACACTLQILSFTSTSAHFEVLEPMSALHILQKLNRFHELTIITQVQAIYFPKHPHFQYKYIHTHTCICAHLYN